MGRASYDPSTGAEQVGQELGVSDWLTIDQDRINRFADCTGDHQWIHVDVAKAQKYSPFGTTIAHGYLTLSLLASAELGLDVVPGKVASAINYGLDKVRFLTPVKVGSRIRNRVALVSAEPQDKGRLLLKLQNTVEIDGESKPALIAETLVLLFLLP
jgi:acyl dehydratase